MMAWSSKDQVIVMWYVANAVLYLKHVNRNDQLSYVVWENSYLIEADSDASAFELAEQRAREDEDHFEGPDCGTYENGVPAEWVFAGIRGIARVENYNERPGSGDEVGFREFRLQSLEEIEKLASGELVHIEY